MKYTGKKKVIDIAIRTNHDGVHSFPNKLLARYKTADGIGIGSKLKKLQRVFGKKLKKAYAEGPSRVYEVKGPGKRRTVFSTYKPAGKKPFVAYLSINKR